MGWGSGTALFPYLVSPLSAIQREAVEQGIAVDWMLDDTKIKLARWKARRSQVALVFIGSPVSEVLGKICQSLAKGPPIQSGEEYINVKGRIVRKRWISSWR